MCPGPQAGDGGFGATRPGGSGKDGTVSWTVIVAMKRLDSAKSRLRGALSGVDHHALVLAMALDTLTAALASPVVGRVVVVTPDPLVRDAVTGLGAEAVLDVPDAGLNPALAYAATLTRPHAAAASPPALAALTGDLPALRTGELTAALRRADEAAASRAPRRAFVADTPGTGTVLLAAPAGASLEPCFGPGSAAAHLGTGALELGGHWPGLRRDVDTAADLTEAILLGVGTYTSGVATTTPQDATARTGQ
jgi:2-phospho-L-lactate guanylyltransferase